MWAPPWIGSRLSGVTDTAAFRRWFGGSKIVDEIGEPLIVYHGGADIANTAGRQFRPGKALGKWGTGIYFTPDKWRAQDYADRNDGVVGAYYLRMENPLVRYESQAYSEQNDEIVRRAKETHDGLIIVQSDVGRPVRLQRNVTEIVVFDPRQIKSATGNTTFDPTNPDILMGVR